MRRVVITEELIKTYPHKDSKNSPSRPYCKLCSCFDRRVFIKQGQRLTRFKVRILEVGEPAVEVTFRNGTVGYYCVDCWEDPANSCKVESIVKQDYGKYAKPLRSSSSPDTPCS